MKKWTVFLCLALIAALLAGCSAGVPGAVPETSQAVTESDPTEHAGHTPDGAASLRCRVIQRTDDSIVLAGLASDGGDGNAVYRLDLGAVPDAPDTVEAGDAVEITYDGAILETYPAQFSNPTSIRVLAGEFDNLCAVYLAALERIWETDAGLNDGISIIGVDLSATRLTSAEQAAIALCFGQAHNLETVTGTADELQAQGYFTADGPENEPPVSWHWEDGCLFSITEQDQTTVDAVTFDVEKWRSGTGAYFLLDCVTRRDKAGRWNESPDIGSEAIS